MTTRTQTELVEQVISNLGVLAAGQTPQLEDIARVKSVVPPAIEFLRATETYYLGSADSIDDAVFLPISHVVAWECRNDFGVSGDQLQTLADSKEAAIKALKIISRQRPTHETLKTEFI